MKTIPNTADVTVNANSLKIMNIIVIIFQEICALPGIIY